MRGREGKGRDGTPRAEARDVTHPVFASNGTFSSGSVYFSAALWRRLESPIARRYSQQRTPAPLNAPRGRETGENAFPSFAKMA